MAQYENSNEYISAVLAQVRWKAAHECIGRDLREHIEDQQEAYQKEGMAQEEAEKKAVLDMGDALEVGARLDASYRPKSVKALFIPLALLTLVSIACRLLLYPAGEQRLIEYFLSLAAGCGLMILLYNVNVYKLVRYAGYAYFAAVLAVALISIIDGQIGVSELNGALLTKLSYIPLWFPPLFAACVCGARERGMGSLFALGAGVAVAACVLICIPQFLGVVELIAICLFILIAASINGVFGKNRVKPIIICCVAVILAGLIVSTVFFPSRYVRLTTMLSPEADPYGNGWYAMSVRETVSGARLFGYGTDTERTLLAGFSAGEWRSGYAVSDYLITTIMQRYGVIPAATIILALLSFLVLAVYKTLKLKSLVGKVVGSSVILCFLLNTLNYAAVNFGLYSAAVMPLPFVSSGNIPQMINFALAGLMLSLFRTGDLALDSEKGFKRLPRLRVHLEWEKS